MAKIDPRVVTLYNDYIASAARYNPAAAQLAWSRPIHFFDAYLKA